jgi:hypothetical protein
VHVKIHQYDIRAERPHLLYRLLAILCFADDLDREEIGIGGLLGVTGSAPTHRREQGFQAAPGPRLVISDEHSYAHSILSSGIVHVAISS